MVSITSAELFHGMQNTTLLSLFQPSVFSLLTYWESLCTMSAIRNTITEAITPNIKDTLEMTIKCTLDGVGLYSPQIGLHSSDPLASK